MVLSVQTNMQQSQDQTSTQDRGRDDKMEVYVCAHQIWVCAESKVNMENAHLCSNLTIAHLALHH